MNTWYQACKTVAKRLKRTIPEPYRTRTFAGIIGDIKVLSSKKALALISRKKGLGTQYAALYLTTGIDEGKGYQACASEALASVLGKRTAKIITGHILDVGCAVGVTAGILSLEHVIGFDLFIDLVLTARSIDDVTGRRNRYLVADMTKEWPFQPSFDTVVCGLVGHHLKTQRDCVSFFSEANRVLKPSGSLVLTLPSGTVATTSNLLDIVHALELFGFRIDREQSGLVLSQDSAHSLFWMFLIIAEKISSDTDTVFVQPDFAFPAFRIPVPREKKGERVKKTRRSARRVRHTQFALVALTEMEQKFPDTMLDYSTIVTFSRERMR